MDEDSAKETLDFIIQKMPEEGDRTTAIESAASVLCNTIQ